MDTTKVARRKANNACSQRARELKKRNLELVLRLAKAFEIKALACEHPFGVEAYEFAEKITGLLTEKTRTLSLKELESLPHLEAEYWGLDLFPSLNQ